MVQADNTWWWLDHERSFVRLDGRQPKIVSQPIQAILRSYDDVSDFVSSYFQFNNRRFIALTSKVNDVSFVYDYVLDAWYQWGVWDSERFIYHFWPVRQIVFSEAWNQYVVLGTDGGMYEISGESSDARLLVRTAHLSHGTNQWKIAREMLIRMKRGFATTPSSPLLMLRWRDNGKHWQNYRLLPLNAQGDYDQIEHIHRLGRYRTRQWEIVYTDSAPAAFVSAELDVEVVDG
jgi:hypothetical protein